MEKLGQETVFRVQIDEKMDSPLAGRRRMRRGVTMNIGPDIRKIYWSLILVFLCFSVAISAAGYVFFGNQKEGVKRETRNQLSAILALKVRQIADWREERKGAGATIQSPLIGHHIQEFLQNPTSVRKQTDILAWMESLRRAQPGQSYRRVILFDSTMAARLSLPEEKTVLKPSSHVTALKAFQEAFQSKRVVLSDLYRDEDSHVTSLGLFVPIVLQQGAESHTLAILLLEIDPNRSLYPLIQTWPTPSLTAESLLVRREGEDVLFLNELRHQKGTALALRFPASSRRLPSAMAVQGQEGVVEGLDYRDVPVLGAIGRIPDSSWFLVAKVDQEEIYSPIRMQARLITGIVGLMVILAAISVGFLWQRQHLKEHRHWEADIKELNKDLEGRAAELERANKELETFSYSVSHDLRTPLVGIRGLSNAVLERYSSNLDDKARHFVSMISKEAQRVLQLINDLMAFSRFQRQEVDRSPIDMGELVTTVLDELMRVMTPQGLKLDIKPLAPSCGDRAMIRQVIHNLLSNAIKFTRDKEICAIEIGSKSGDKEDIFYVKDNGVGFDMQHAGKLFETFHRLHPTEKFEGSGIGLAIVQRIVERHGGRVWAEGAVNEGAVFYFTLPKWPIQR
jgi:two-component system sensor kinase